MPRKYTREIFIKKGNEVHNNKYDYSLVEYVSSKVKVIIVCPDHGPFEQMPNNHLNNKGCPVCSGNVRHSKESFIQKAIEVHGDRYGYGSVKYTNNSTAVEIECPEHGKYCQKPATHLLGHGCRKCANQDKRKYPRDLIRSITKARNCVFNSYRRKGFTKRSKTSELLGCSWKEFKDHLENNPYNFKVSDPDMDLDHIIPISSAETEEDILKLNHYTNFQLLPADYNRWVKSCKLFDKQHFEGWLEENKIKK
tara:strand:+ start:1664 stop:2419 length:756 start_codon:yes stop_codon:yes gene_type:complete